MLFLLGWIFLLIIKRNIFKESNFPCKLNKISFIESYKITKTEDDWKTPSSINMKKYVTKYIKTKELYKQISYIINETTFEEDIPLTKNSQAIGKVISHQIQIILSLQLYQLHPLKYLKKILNYQKNLNHQK